jgi:hypothetical protein
MNAFDKHTSAIVMLYYHQTMHYHIIHPGHWPASVSPLKNVKLNSETLPQSGVRCKYVMERQEYSTVIDIILLRRFTWPWDYNTFGPTGYRNIRIGSAVLLLTRMRGYQIFNKTVSWRVELKLKDERYRSIRITLGPRTEASSSKHHTLLFTIQSAMGLTARVRFLVE